MRHRAGRALASAGLAGIVLSIAVGAATAPTDDESTREAMRRIFGALTELLPVAVDDAAFADPERRAALQPALDVLAASTQALEAHGAARGPGFAALSRSLAGDAREALERLERGHTAEARFYLYQLTENCATCHARLPSARSFPLADRLLDGLHLEHLDPGERARLLVATRQFERAAETWEAALADPSLDPAELDLGELPVDYLSLCIRVLGDLERPRAALEAFGARPDVPRYLRHLVARWTASLAELERRDLRPGLAPARDLAARARDVAVVPSDRSGLVYDLMASSLLHRWVEGRQGPPGALSEGYYLLGVIASRTSHFAWVPEAEFYLEAAIRLMPAGASAEPAYRLLEEYTVLGYGGAGAEHLPADVAARLAELRALLDAPPGRGAASSAAAP